jgi:hypothetical protein
VKSYKRRKLLTILSFSLILVLMVPTVHFSVADATPPNFVLIYDQPWLYQKRNILDVEYRQKLLSDLSAANCKYAVVFIGYWDATNPASPQIYPTSGVQSGPQNYVRNPAFYQELITQLHNINIQVLCWLEDGIGEMDISPLNTQQNIVPKILDAVNIGFDGFADDMESWQGMTGNMTADLNTKIVYLESITDALHAIGKIHCPFTAHDWTQYLNPRLNNVDYNLQMFYGAHTVLQDSRVSAFWQEEFGQLGRDTPPASPVIIGLMIHNGNNPPYDTMAGQIEKLNQLIKDYPHPQLHGFFIWLYEYMNDDDWAAWNGWVPTLSDKGIPPSAPLPSQSPSPSSTPTPTTSPTANPTPTPTPTPYQSPTESPSQTPNTPLDQKGSPTTIYVAIITIAFAAIAIAGLLLRRKR